MEALWREIRVRCPWELLYVDDLEILSHFPEDLKNRLVAWKSSMESHGLGVSVYSLHTYCLFVESIQRIATYLH